jgi:hypothetical protein
VINLLYYLAGQITSKAKNKDENTFVLNQIRIRQYPTIVTPSVVITDYISSVRYNGKNPIIVGKCNIASEPQCLVLSRTLSGPDIPYEFLENYRRFFTDGFVISTSILTEEKLSTIIAPNMKATGAKVLWKVNYTD